MKARKLSKKTSLSRSSDGNKSKKIRHKNSIRYFNLNCVLGVKKRGRKRVHSDEQIVQIQEAALEKYTAADLRKKLKLRGSIRTIQRVMRKARKLGKYELGLMDLVCRVTFCQKYCQFGRWDQILFTGVKKFSLIGPGKKSRPFKNRSVNVWAGVSYHEILPLLFNVEPMAALQKQTKELKKKKRPS